MICVYRNRNIFQIILNCDIAISNTTISSYNSSTIKNATKKVLKKRYFIALSMFLFPPRWKSFRLSKFENQILREANQISDRRVRNFLRRDKSTERILLIERRG